jgi:hypothetical protein
MTTIGLGLASWLPAMSEAPENALVCVSRAERIMVPQGLGSPRLLYPQGRIDIAVIEQLMDSCLESLVGSRGTAAWRELVSPLDRVGILVDAGDYPVLPNTVEVIIDRLVGVGVQPDNICVIGGDERDLFAAGFNIRREGRGVKVQGAAGEGFRAGISRLVTDYSDVIINVGSLRVDPELGLAGCVANTLNVVPYPQRAKLRRDPLAIGAVGASPALRQKLRLCLLEAYLPAFAGTGSERETWQYKGLLASTDPVAIDVIGQQILETHRGLQIGAPSPLSPAPDYLAAAHRHNRLGQSDPAHITIRYQGPEAEAYLP